MLLFRNGLGLGATIQLDPRIAANTDAAPRPGTVSTGDTTPFFAIKQHTWGQIVREFLPGYPSIDDAQLITEARNNALRAIAAGLPSCPPGGLTNNGTECYYGNTFFEQLDVSEFALLAPGTFSWFGVVFSVNEMANARFTRSFVPTPWQRRNLELAVIINSHRTLFGYSGIRTGDGPNEWFRDGSPLPIIGDGVIAKAIIKANSTTWLRRSKVISTYAERASVDDILKIVPEMALFFVNFDRNPVQPTTTERTSVGGWKSWISRGGYPLFRPFVQAKMALYGDRGTIGFPASIHCQCPTTGMPNAMPGFLTKSGVGAHGDEIATWTPLLSIPQDGVDRTFTLTLVGADDSSWIRDVGKYGEKILTYIGRAYCDPNVQAVVQQNLASKSAEQCADTATGKPCTKGQPNCKCFTPPAYAQASVAASRSMQSWLCGKFMQETAPPVELTPPSAYPDAGNFDAARHRIPWWLVVGLGVTAGAIAFRKR